uniref:Uncharacterized protein n=1 Tax=Haemonchus contortus TaxID=6289 RepID=W6NAQ9_HAECO
MVWPSKTLAVVVFILQIAQSPSCTFTEIYRAVSSLPDPISTNPSTSLYECLKACYLIEICKYAQFSSTTE